MSKTGAQLDAIVVGSGPNGLVAAAVLARAGLSVRVLEGSETPGGGTRCDDTLTLPGFLHDVCSAVHPMGALSPAFQELGLDRSGLEWIHPRYSVAHPLEGREAVLLERSVEATAARLGGDERAYRALVGPFLRRPERFFRDVLAPPGIPGAPLTFLRFGLRGLRSATNLARRWFREDEARALLAGCAGHSILPLDRALTGAVGLVFVLSAHATDWPVARGGSQAVAHALSRVLEKHGGQIVTGQAVRSLAQLPPARAILFDLAPRQVMSIAASALPASYLRRLGQYRYGPGVFKVDWALDGPIPWSDPRCAEASTVHVGGTLEEIAAAEAAVWRGEHPRRPYLIVCQQSHFDPGRAPDGKHTGYAYCHVPNGSDVDQTEVIESQVERFAPGFRDRILARFTRSARGFEHYNPSYVGGAITGGVADLRQIVARPALRWNPYTTPNPRLFICSQASPPGGGVHGMCGYHAARTVLRRLRSGRLS